MIVATEVDRPLVEAFLHAHIETAMFPLSNLAMHGMAGGHARAMTFWVRWQDGAITDVLGLSDQGMVFPNCPTGPWGEVTVALADAVVIGIIGEASQVTACRAALGLYGKAELDVEEPHFRLKLNDLRIPDADNLTLHPLADAPLGLMTQWRTDFCEESLFCTPKDAAARAVQDVAGYLAQDTHRVLAQGSEPVAMTGFNAVLPKVVQVGGVFTPKDYRSRGFARTAVALHLAEARSKGVTDAILSAANDAASRAYEAIGFRRCGTFAIVAYNDPQVIRA